MRAPVEEKAWETLPEGIQVEPSGGGTIFRWRVLPGSPGLIIFFAALALLVLSLGLLGVFLLVGAVSDLLNVLESAFKGYADFEIIVAGIVLVFLLVKTWNFFATILFGRCRLALSPSELNYEVFLFGRKVRAKSRKLAAADITAFAIKDAARKGLEVQQRGGLPFYLMLQRFSEAELLRIKKHFLRLLGR